MITVRHIWVYETMAQGYDSIFISAMTYLDNYANTLWNFLVFPSQFFVYFDSEKFDLWHCLNYLIFDA